MRWACADVSLPKNMGMQYGTARNLGTITILPVRLQSYQKDHLQETNAHSVQPMMQPMTPGVESPKKGIGSGHHQIPDTCRNDMESEFHD